MEIKRIIPEQAHRKKPHESEHQARSNKRGGPDSAADEQQHDISLSTNRTCEGDDVKRTFTVLGVAAALAVTCAIGFAQSQQREPRFGTRRR